MATMSVQTPYGGGSGWDPWHSFLESGMDFAFGEAAADEAMQRQQELGQMQYFMNLQAMKDGPKAMREGLEKAGYNPILAVNSAGGASFSNSIPGAPMAQLHGSHAQAGGNVNSALAAQIKKTNAETDLIKRRTEAEGWQVKTLSRSEAMGLGANALKMLGINFNHSDQDTFLVAYNPITGELRSLGGTDDSLHSTGPVSNAADLPVDWKTFKNLNYDYKDYEIKPEYK